MCRRGLVWVVHIFLYLDYGTIYDSTGGHVDGWVASIFWKDASGADLEWLFVLFYDKERIGSETNKNANTGMMCLRELVRTTTVRQPPQLPMLPTPHKQRQQRR